jgi:hypothetical protein
MSITIFWLVLQLFVLTIYPRLEAPGIRKTLVFAAKLILRWPVPTLFVAFVGMGFGLVSLFVPILPILITFSLIAILANRTTTEILTEEGKRGRTNEI